MYVCISAYRPTVYRLKSLPCWMHMYMQISDEISMFKIFIDFIVFLENVSRFKASWAIHISWSKLLCVRLGAQIVTDAHRLVILHAHELLMNLDHKPKIGHPDVLYWVLSHHRNNCVWIVSVSYWSTTTKFALCSWHGCTNWQIHPRFDLLLETTRVKM